MWSGELIRAADEYCLNFGFLGRGASDPGAVEETVAGGALGVKIHEDFGASPAVIDGSLIAADRNDFAVHLHSDTINEYGFCEDTLAAIDGRTIHMYHIEGAGGGHAPDLLRVNGFANVIPSSTNPTNPFTAYALNEGVPMTMLAHILNYRLPEDVAFAESRIRPQTMAAEDLLHDMGAISIFATDTQGMGRLAENIAKCWQLASVMKERVGRLPTEKTERADNERIRRYVAKYTINPARAVGIDEHVGSLEPGKLADIVLWPRNSFGVKPWMVIKGGFVAWAAMGDGNASQTNPSRSSSGRCGERWGRRSTSWAIPSCPGWRWRPMWSASWACRNAFIQIRNIRGITKRDMLHNDAMPNITVDSQTFDVYADGALLTCAPAKKVPLNRRYMLR